MAIYDDYHTDESLAESLRLRIKDLPDMKGRSPRTQLQKWLYKLADRVRALEKSIEDLDAARVKAEAQIIYLENLEQKKNGDGERRHKYTKFRGRDGIRL